MVRVYARVRPISPREVEYEVSVRATSSTAISVTSTTKMKHEEKTLNFHRVFGKEALSGEVQDGIVPDLVQSFGEGENTVIFSFGRSGAGKSFTLFGDEDTSGLVMATLSRQMSGRTETAQIAAVQSDGVSAVDQYIGRSINIMPDLTPHPEKFEIQGLPWKIVKGLRGAQRLLQRVLTTRKTRATAANDSSSREQLLIALRVTNGEKEVDTYFVDLCGAENLDEANGPEESAESRKISMVLYYLRHTIMQIANAHGSKATKGTWNHWYGQSPFLRLFQNFFEGERSRASGRLNFIVCLREAEEKDAEMTTIVEFIQKTGVIAAPAITHSAPAVSDTPEAIIEATAKPRALPPRKSKRLVTANKKKLKSLTGKLRTRSSRRINLVAAVRTLANVVSSHETYHQRGYNQGVVVTKSQNTPSSTANQLPENKTFQSAFARSGINRDNCFIEQRDVNSLEPSIYVTDNVVDLAIKMAKSNHLRPITTIDWQRLRSGFSMEQAVAKCKRIMDSGSVIGIPVCVNHHWLLVIVDHVEIKVWDSLISHSERYCGYDLIKGVLNSTLTDVRRPLTVVRDCVQQKPGGNNCAVYVSYRMVFWDEIRDGEISEAQLSGYVEDRGRADLRAIAEAVCGGRITQNPHPVNDNSAAETSILAQNFEGSGGDEAMPDAGAGVGRKRTAEPTKKRKKSSAAGHGYWQVRIGSVTTLVPPARQDPQTGSFVCGTCEAAGSMKLFKRRANYTNHHAVVHANVHPHQCRECDFATAKASALKNHIKNHHGKE